MQIDPAAGTLSNSVTATTINLAPSQIVFTSRGQRGAGRAPAPHGSSNMIRFGILGFGLHAAKRLMPGFALAQNCRVTALSRRSMDKAQETARKHDIRWPLTRLKICAGLRS